MSELLTDVVLRPVHLDGDGPDADGSDVDLALAVADAAEVAVLGVGETTREDVRTLLAGPDCPRDGQTLALVGDRPVGLVAVEVTDSTRDVFVDAYATPDAPDGLLHALVARGVGYATTVAKAAPPSRDEVDAVTDPYQPTSAIWQADAGSYAEDEAYAKVLEDNGFRRIRRHWRMHLDLAAAGVGPDDPAPPEGVARTVARDAEQTRELHRVFEESFRDHFGTRPRPYQEWITAVGALPGVDPDRWYLALLDGTPVGLLILDDSRAEFGDSYVRTLGVVREARGRGIARWLLGCAFADAVRRGLTGVQLTVDSDSLTGATRLYEGMGMRPRRVIDAWRLPL